MAESSKLDFIVGVKKIKYNKKITHFYAIILILCLLTFITPLKVNAESISVIVNSSNPTSKLSKSEIRDYFLKIKTLWANGEKVTPLDKKIGDPAKNIFLKGLLEHTATSLDLYWLKRKNQDGQYAPQKISTDSLVIKLVEKLEWSIGYVKTSSLYDQTLDGVKVVAVIEDHK